MLLFKCDICGATENQKSNTFTMNHRTDICKECLSLLDKAADLLKLPKFKEQLEDLHVKYIKGK